MSNLDNRELFDAMLALRIKTEENLYEFRKQRPPEGARSPLFQCGHCRSKYSNAHGSCPNCGSPDSKILWMPGSRYPAY